MRNFYLYLAGIALLVSGAEVMRTLSEAPSPSKEWILQNEKRYAPKSKERVPFLRNREKSGAITFLAPSISATSTVALTIDTGVPGPTGIPGPSAGDELEYTVIITNGGPDPANVTAFTETVDVNTTLVPGSLKASPIAQNDAYSTIGNVGISVPAAQGLFANDVSPAGTALSLNSTASFNTENNNGTVTITAATGAFTYEPAVGYTGTDSFTYKIQNDSGVLSEATVTITVASMIWFIDDDAAIGGTGTLAKPFKTLGAFQAINDGGANHAKDAHFIFIYSGSYDGGITVRNNQKVFGQGATSSLLTLTGLSAPSGGNLLPSTSGARPALTNTSGNVFSLSGVATVQGLNIGNSSGAKFLSSATGTFTASQIDLTGTGVALNISGKALAATFGQVSSSVSGRISPVKLSTVTGSLTITSGTLTATNTPALDISGGIALAVNLTAVNVNGGNKGLIISGTSGTFQVSGSGTTAGSGGTIQNIAQRGVELLNTNGITLKNMNLANANQNDGTEPLGSSSDMNNLGANAAVYALNTNGLTMDRVAISGTVAQEGINLRGSSNFNFTNGSIGKSGSQNNLFEGCIFAVNTGGVNTITNSTMTDPGGRVAYFANFSTNMTSLTVDNSTFQDADFASGLQVVGYGNSNVKVRVQNNSKFLNCRTVGAEVLANETAVMTADIKNSTVDPGAGVGRGFDVSAFGSATMKFNIESNSVKHYGGIGINSFAFANAYIEGTIKNNTTENLPGSNGVSGIVSSSEAIIAGANTAKATVLIQGNTVKNATNIHGISTQVNNIGGARSNFTFINNTVEVVGGSSFFYGIDVNAPDLDATPNNSAIICSNVTGNTITIPGIRRVYRARAGSPNSTVLSMGNVNSIQRVWSAGGNTPAGTDDAPRALQSGFGIFTFNVSTCPLPGALGFREGLAEALPEEKMIPEPVTAEAEEPVIEEPASEVAVAIPSNSPAINESIETGSPANARTEGVLAGETVTVNGTGTGFTLPASKSTTIKFKVTINNNIPTSVCAVSTQGTVSGSNFSPVVTDGPGGNTTNPTVTTVTSVPVITFCPGNLVVNPDAGTCTSTQTFTPVAAGCPAPGFTYSVGGTPISLPHAFPSGVSTVLVTASNGIGAAPTCSFTVTVTPTPAPIITQDPVAQTICAATNTSFAVVATGTITSYQWQKKPSGGSFANINAGTNASAATATLSLTNVPASDNLSEYRCIVGNACNNSTSAPAILTVNPQITASSLTGTASVTQAARAPIVTFGATGGTLPYTFEYKISGGSALTVSTTGVLTSVGVTQSTNVLGFFRYVLTKVTDAKGCTFTPATEQAAEVTVVNNLTATILPLVTTVCVGAPSPQVTFTAVNGIPPFTFSYRINGGALVDLSTTGATRTASITIPATAPGINTCLLVNVTGAGGGSAFINQSVNVNINAAPSLTLTVDPYQCATGLATYTASFTAAAGSVVTSDKGTVTGNTVTGIPSNETGIITATRDGCSSSVSAFQNCALPVTLFDFGASKQENTVMLRWKTSSETNSEKFDVEHSTDGKKWRNIGSQRSGGESAAVLNYSFLDKNPVQGGNFYRLKMIDLDQTFAYSRIVSVTMNSVLTTTFYPNPVSDLLYISTSDWNQVASVELIDVQGRKVYRSGSNLIRTIQVKEIPVGIYLLAIIHKNGVVSNQKVLINR
jgi:uncharacterized repeat protein (TIGR01451 family)